MCSNEDPAQPKIKKENLNLKNSFDEKKENYRHSSTVLPSKLSEVTGSPHIFPRDYKGNPLSNLQIHVSLLPNDQLMNQHHMFSAFVMAILYSL